jgi:hypothetical protein
VALVDKYNTIVGNTNQAKLIVKVDPVYNINNSKSLKYMPMIEGNS